MILNLRGTSKKSFIISEANAQFKLSLACNATMTENMTITFPAANGTSGQVLTTDGSGNLSWSNASAFGTIIPDGGSLTEASYEGDVVCLGSVDLNSVAGIAIKGDLYILGNLSYTSGTGLEVSGDIICSGNFEPWVNATSGNNPTITGHGDLIVTGSSFTFKNSGTASAFTIYGNLIAVAAKLDFSRNATATTDGTGSSLTVGGNCKCNGLDTSSDSGNGGSVTIYGELVSSTDAVSLSGGTPTAEGNGGNGGALDVKGDCFAGSLDVKGGTGLTNGNGGNAGNISTEGDLIIDGLLAAYGAAGVGTGNGGNSSNITVRGNLSFDDANIYSGAAGTVGAGGTCSGLSVDGDLIKKSVGIGSIDAYGGAGGSTSGNGAAGSLINILGDLIGNFVQINTYGGASTLGDGGNGGALTVRGATKCNESVLNASGGVATTGTGGTAGTCKFYDMVHLTTLTSIGASGSVAFGSAGDIYIYNGCKLDTLTFTDDSGVATAAAIRIGGSCLIKTLNFEDRVACTLIPLNDGSCTLQVGALSGKDDFNATGGNLTGITLPNKKLFWHDTVNQEWVYAVNKTGEVFMFAKPFTFADQGSQVSMFTLPANALVDRTKIIVTTVFDDTGSVAAKVGVNGGVSDKYLAITENDLYTVGVYGAEKALVPNTSAEVLELDVSAGNADGTQGAGRVVMTFANPIAA